MPWFDHDTSRIYYEERGGGDPALLLPGFAGSIDDLVPIADALAGRYRVIAADLPGSGRSEPRPRDYTAGYYREDARAFAALLERVAGRPAHLVGFSDGGEVALLMAASAPSAARSVVAWGAAGALTEAQRPIFGLLANVVDDPSPEFRAFSDHLRAAYGEADARATIRSFVAAVRAILDAGGDISRSRAGSVACPVLLVAGELDPVAPPALVGELAERLPDAELREVPGVGHDVHVQRPDWLARAVLDWLEER